MMLLWAVVLMTNFAACFFVMISAVAVFNDDDFIAYTFGTVGVLTHFGALYLAYYIGGLTP